MGDAAFLKRLSAEVRGTTRSARRPGARDAMSGNELSMASPWSILKSGEENQRQERTVPGSATVMLPSMDPGTRSVIDGSPLRLKSYASGQEA